MPQPDARVLKDLATDATARGDIRKALDLYRKIAEIEPSDGRWWMKIGETQRALGDNDGAVAAFREASARYGRAGFELKAVAACRVLLQIAPEDTEALGMLERLLPRVSNPGAVAMPNEAASAPSIATPAEADGPEISEEPDERITLEQIEVGKILPASHASDAPEGTVDLEIDRRAPPADTGYLDLTFDEFELPAPEPTVRKPAAPAQPAESPGARLLARSAAASASQSAPTTGPANPTPTAAVVPVPSPVESAAVPPNEAARSQAPVDPGRLRGLPLLGPLPPEALEMFVRSIDYRTVAPGDRVITEGEVPDSVYIVVRGDLVASRGTPPKPLARLGEGAFFGEMALLDDTPRSATVVAVTDCELLVLPRRVVLQICEQYPAVLATLMQSLRSRLIATLTSTSPLFALIPAGERKRIVERFRLREIEPGTVIITEGQRADALYVLLTGRAEVESGGAVVATLTTGDVCGEMSLLAHGRAEASVRTHTRVIALTLPAADLQEVIMVHPQVLEHLASLSESRRAQLATRRSVEARNVRRV